MLDNWLGTDRNGKGVDVITDYDDDRVCKYSLAGCCPFTLLLNTRMDKGPCRCEVCPVPKNLRDAYMRDRNGIPTQYDQQLYDQLDKILAVADKHIAYSKSIRESKSSRIEDHPEIKQKVSEMNNLLKDCRRRGSQGKVSEALSILFRAEIVKEQYANKEAELMKIQQEKEQNLVICEVCTAVIKQADMEGRMEDHCRGRQHQAFAKMRETFENLKSAGIISKKKNSRFNRRRSSEYGPPPIRKLVPLDFD